MEVPICGNIPWNVQLETPKVDSVSRSCHYLLRNTLHRKSRHLWKIMFEPHFAVNFLVRIFNHDLRQQIRQQASNLNHARCDFFLSVGNWNLKQFYPLSPKNKLSSLSGFEINVCTTIIVELPFSIPHAWHSTQLIFWKRILWLQPKMMRNENK